MTKKEFEDEIRRLLARVHRLQAAVDGSARVTYTRVKRHYVDGFWVSAHDRMVVTAKPKRKGAGRGRR